MQGELPLVKVLFLKKEGEDQRLVVNKSVMLDGQPLTVETWLRNKHGVWNGTFNQIQLNTPLLKAGDAYPFTCVFWTSPVMSKDRVPMVGQ